MAYQIFIDSSCDMPLSVRKERNISYFRMGFTLNGEDKYADMDWVDYTPEILYGWIRDPKNVIKTSLLSGKEVIEKCEPLLEKGIDILYLTCTTALSGSKGVFDLMKEDLLAKYPERRMVSIDSERSEMSMGLIALHMADLRDQGKTIDELKEWFDKEHQHFHQVGSLETLTYLKRQGRVSGAAAFFANTFGIKPVIIQDIHGMNHIIAKKKGSRSAMDASFDYIKAHVNERTKEVWIGQAMAQETQAYLKKRVEEELNIPVKEFWIGPIVGISCGPGMYGCYFEGDEVTIDGKNVK